MMEPSIKISKDQPKDPNPNNLLSALSSSYKDSSLVNPRSLAQEIPLRESAETRLNIIPPKDPLVEQSQDKPIIYPCPQPSYNPKRCPPDLIKAVKHGHAHKVVRAQASNWLGEVCESTGLPVVFRDIKLCASMEDLYFLGPVIPMYFQLVKQLAFVAFILSFIPIATFIANYDGLTGYDSFVAPIFNNEFIVSLSSFSILFVLFVLMYIFRRSQKKTKLACKKGVITPSDYTVMAYNLGKNYIDEEVRTFLSNYIIPGYSLDLCKISTTYDIQDYVKRARKIQCLYHNKAKMEQISNYVASGVVTEIEDRIDREEQFFAKIEDLNPSGLELNKNGLCFVTFNTKLEAKAVRRKFEFSILERVMIWLLEKCTDDFPEYFFKQNYIKVERAPELKEILWENLNCQRSKKGIAFVNLIAISIIFALTFISLLLIKTYLPFASVIMGLATAISNEAVSLVISLIACRERFKTITEWNIALAQRTAFLQFLNTAVPIFILDNINISSLGLSSSQLPDFAFDVLCIFGFTCFVPLLFRFINISYLEKKMLRKKIDYQVKTNSNSCGITQEEANHAYEDADFNINHLYADTIKTFLLSCLFMNISPGISVVAFISYFVGYHIDKFNLLRRSLQPSNLRSEISETLFEFLDIGIFLIALGNNFFINLNSLGTNVSNSISIAGIILAMVYLGLPHKRFARSCFSAKKELSWSNILFYQQAMEYFSYDHHNSNPGSKILKQPYQKLKKAVKIEQKVYEGANRVPDLFSYAVSRPSLSEAVMNRLIGLKNPYYIFPQNYTYGAMHFASANVLNKEDAAIKVPLIGDQSKGSAEKTRNGKGGPRANEMLASLTNSFEVGGKFSGGEHSGKGNSILKDILMLPSFSGKSTLGMKLSDGSNKKEDYLQSLNENDEYSQNNNSIRGRNGFNNNLSSSPSNLGIIEGISPITGGMMDNNQKRSRENYIVKRS